MPKKIYAMNFVQADRFTGDGMPIVSTADVSAKTGFAPGNPATAQIGFQNAAGSSTGQMEGNTVGAYLNTNDLVTSVTDQTLMITPEYRWILPPWMDLSAPYPYTDSSTVLYGALDLQVPTAVGGNDVYVNQGHRFMDPTGFEVTFNIGFFHNNATSPGLGLTVDKTGRVYIINNPMGVITTYCTPAVGSAVYSPTPWSGFRHFEWSITYTQFQAALHALDAANPGVLTTFDPSQFRLATTHLNAELHTLGSAATIELGWSMKNLELWTAEI
jgi:hypothetical protein